MNTSLSKSKNLKKLVEGVRHASWNGLPISDQNLWFSLPYFQTPYFRPDP